MCSPDLFLPKEDKGFVIIDIQLPPGASQSRTVEVVKQVEAHFATEPAMDNSTFVLGYNFSGNGQNAALGFAVLKGWSWRGSNDSAAAITDRANAALSQIKQAEVLVVSPAPVTKRGRRASTSRPNSWAPNTFCSARYLVAA